MHTLFTRSCHGFNAWSIDWKLSITSTGEYWDDYFIPFSCLIIELFQHNPSAVTDGNKTLKPAAVCDALITSC